MSDLIYTDTAEALSKITERMQQLGLWSDVAPSAEAMADPSPFCYESMPFEHWLQFIFIPKMSALVNNKQPLPAQFSVSAMAELRFDKQPQAQVLIDELLALEARLNAPR
ncbi:YqcC family protein [Shewanella waksmanii]|uniref:YqcC family protein n=1 Tax=Shewanella waksmanii TaxID=213783 RepID=UPI0037361775